MLMFLGVLFVLAFWDRASPCRSGFELLILQPQPLKYWDYKYAHTPDSHFNISGQK